MGPEGQPHLELDLVDVRRRLSAALSHVPEGRLPGRCRRSGAPDLGLRERSDTQKRRPAGTAGQQPRFFFANNLDIVTMREGFDSATMC